MAYAANVRDAYLEGWAFYVGCAGGGSLVVFAASLGISLLCLNSPERPSPRRSEQNGVANDGYSDIISNTYMDIQSVLSHQDNVSPEHQSQRPYTYANDSVLPSGVSKTQTISYPTQGRHGNQTFGREIHRLYVNNNASVLPSGISRQQSSSHPLSGYQPHGSHRPPEQGSSSQRQDVEPILEELDSVLARNPYQVINDVLDCAPVPDDVTNHCQDGGQRKASHPGASRPGSPPLKSTEEHNVTVVTPTTTPEGEAIYETIGKPC